MIEHIRIRGLLLRKVFGAILGACAVATFFSLFGYSDGATFSDYAKELGLGLVSYLTAAVLTLRLTKRDSVLLDITGVTLIGSALSFLAKSIFLEGQNGIPAYLARATRDHWWKAIGDLASDAVSFVILVMLLSLPFVAIGAWIYQLWEKSRMATSDRV